MSPLDRAVSLVEVDVVSMHITKHLNFDVPWLFDILFNEHMVVAETLHALSLGCLELVKEFALLHHNSHSFASSSEGSLKHNRESNLLGFREQEVRVLIVAMVALDDGHLGVVHNHFGLALGTHSHDGFDWWSDENQVVLLKSLHEFGVLR